MTLRPFRFPADFQTGLEIVNRAFSYEDHPEWNFTDAERQNITDQINAFARWWPFLQVICRISPGVMDTLRGFMWEEDTHPVGLITCHARGAGRWEIGYLAVLPQVRRRGIARQLLQGALDYIRQRDGKIVTLSTSAENRPACTLYEQMGFEQFSKDIGFHFDHADPIPSQAVIPGGYSLQPLRFLTRQPVYELDRRVIPPAIARYQAIEPGRYRLSWPEKLFYWVMGKLSGFSTQEMIVQTGSEVVAWGRFQAHTRPGGVHYLSLRCDPAHPQVAGYLLRHLVHSALAAAPGKDVEFTLAEWQKPEMEAALALGCRQDEGDYISLGLAF